MPAYHFFSAKSRATRFVAFHNAEDLNACL